MYRCIVYFRLSALENDKITRKQRTFSRHVYLIRREGAPHGLWALEKLPFLRTCTHHCERLNSINYLSVSSSFPTRFQRAWTHTSRGIMSVALSFNAWSIESPLISVPWMTSPRWQIPEPTAVISVPGNKRRRERERDAARKEIPPQSGRVCVDGEAGGFDWGDYNKNRKSATRAAISESGGLGTGRVEGTTATRHDGSVVSNHTDLHF